MDTAGSPYRGYRFPAEIISYCVWLYFRFSVSYRDVEELMAERGVIVSINSDSAEEARHLNQEAAKSMKFGGLSHDEALKLVTLNPAIQLGIDKRVGTIDAGKDADLVIYNHDPLSAYAVVQKTLVDGRVYFDRQRDIAERPEREKEKKALLEKEKKSSEKKPDATVTIGQKPKPEAKKPEEKKPEEKKPEEKPKPPKIANDREGAERNLPVSVALSGGAR